MKSLIHTIAEMTKSALGMFTGSHWQDARYEYSSGDPIYIGLNTQHNAPTDKETWSIWKLTYSSGDLVRKEGPFVASWDNRTNLNWA